MKHLKGVNRKGRKIEKTDPGAPVVEAQGIVPFMHTCTSVFNPGYENDWTGSTKQLCTPIETDLFGTTDMYCWWPWAAAANCLQQPGLERRLHAGDEGLDEAQGRQAGVVGSGGAIND